MRPMEHDGEARASIDQMKWPLCGGMRGNMDQKVYKIMRGAGAADIAIGVIHLIVGIVTGILLIVAGAKLIAGKSKILF